MNKKLLILLSTFIFLSFCFSQSYRISDTEFDIKGVGFSFLGKTKPYSVKTKYPLDTKKVFPTEVDLLSYLSNYEKTLISSRFFDLVEIEYEYGYDDKFSSDEYENSIIPVKLFIKLQDSHHLLFMPYPKLSSNTGLTLKLKAKDTNFLGSLETLGTEIRFDYSDEGIDTGFAISFDSPFKMGIFDAQFINNYEITYNFSNSMPEWDAKTGLKMTLPVNENSFIFEIYQYFTNNLDYEIYNDSMFFTNEFSFSTPINIFSFSNFTNLYYTPKISFLFNWDFDGINILNDDLSGPTISFNHSISNDKVLWDNCFRNGYNFSISNSFSYNIQRNDIYPYLSFDFQYFNYMFITKNPKILERIGLCTDISFFSYIYLPDNSFVCTKKIGSYMRGILDNKISSSDDFNDSKYNTTTALIFNIDLPIHLFTTSFKKEIFNFNCQLSPFIDIALTLNQYKQTLFSLKDGCYTAGVEFLVYPLKWSSYTLRASVGFDVLKVLKSDSKLKGLLKYNEIFIGIGLHY